MGYLHQPQRLCILYAETLFEDFGACVLGWSLAIPLAKLCEALQFNKPIRRLVNRVNLDERRLVQPGFVTILTHSPAVAFGLLLLSHRSEFKPDRRSFALEAFPNTGTVRSK
jgi:hypothetical protein